MWNKRNEAVEWNIRKSDGVVCGGTKETKQRSGSVLNVEFKIIGSVICGCEIKIDMEQKK